MNNNESLFRSSSVWKSILTMSLPALVTILVMIFYNMADMFFIAQLKDTALVAAVSLISPAFSLMMAFATMIGAGGCVLIGNALGSTDLDKAHSRSALCFWASLTVGVFLALAVLFAREPLLTFLGAKPDTVEAARTYITTLALGAPVMIANSACATLIRAEGAVKESLIGNLAGTATNMILDPVFILIFRWSVAGAAVATVLGNMVGLIYYIWFILRRSKVMSLSLKKAAGGMRELGRVFLVGAPNALNTLLSGFASTFSNQLLADYGSDYVAAVGAAGKVSLLITMVQMGICMGVQPLLSYSYGAGDKDRMGETLRKTGILTIGVGLASTALCIIFREPLIRLFLKTNDVVDIGGHYVLYLIAGSAFLGFFYISSNYLQAAQHPALAMVVSTLRQGVLLIPLLYLLHAVLGFRGIGLAHTMADIGSAMIAFIIFLWAFWKFKNAPDKESSL